MHALTVLTHAFGRRYDLPIPLALFVVGGVAVVIVSFLLVLPRPAGAEPELPAEDAAAEGRRRPPLWPGLASVVLLGALVAGGLAGSQTIAENILPTTFWLLVWIGVPLTCGLLGDWTRPVNPFATLARLADRPGLRRLVLARERPFRWPGWLGWWVAVLLYFALACGELVVNLWATRPAVIATALSAYALVCLLGGLVFGPAWGSRGEVFAVLFDTWGRLGWFRFGQPGRRGFGGGLVVPFARSLSRTSFVLLLLISINFDGLLATPAWARFELRSVGQAQAHVQPFRTVAFLVLALLLGAVFAGFAKAAGTLTRRPEGSRWALSGLLPSLLPIAFGYLIAHNAQYLFVNAQLMLPLIGNPIGGNSWPIHLPFPFNDSYEPHNSLPSAFYWYLGVAAIVLAHVAAVVVAHRHLHRAGRDLRVARASEYPWLVAMVGYTAFSLVLIAQPLVQEASK